MPAPLERLEEQFTAVMAMAAPDRAAFLASAQKADPALAAELTALVAAYETSADFLEEIPVGSLATLGRSAAERNAGADEIAGARIGRFRVVEKIGEGGCGIVYLAEQEQPVQRRVALKILKLGMDTRAVVARFEAERQALALMDHPNIARVFDAGETDRGRPFFVMELVSGVPINWAYSVTNVRSVNGASVAFAMPKSMILGFVEPSWLPTSTLDGLMSRWMTPF